MQGKASVMTSKKRSTWENTQVSWAEASGVMARIETGGKRAVVFNASFPLIRQRQELPPMALHSQGECRGTCVTVFTF